MIVNKTPVALAFMLMTSAPALAIAQTASRTPAEEMADLRAQLSAQQRLIEAQRARLEALETRVSGMDAASGANGMASASPGPTARTPGTVPLPPSPPAAPPSAGVQTVGEAPTDQREVQVAALAEQGGIITQAGRLTLEGNFEYARADRNRVIFRGVEIPQSVLIGVFDINESRQDVLTAGLSARLGLTSRLEISASVPYIYRSDKSVLAPVADPNSPNAGQIDKPVSDGGLGDISFGARYQITNGTRGWPYLIAGVQAVAPTGRSPFLVRRDNLGNALEAATGAGFWGLTPSVTAILPTDPAVLFGTLGYTFNFGRTINRMIGPAFIERVTPGGEPSATMGIALSLNPRTSLSFGYAHTWSMGTKTRLRVQDPQTGAMGNPMTTNSRDLQLGRFLFGVSYRSSPRTTINWNVEMGATDDATDLRTSLRIPFTLNAF